LGGALSLVSNSAIRAINTVICAVCASIWAACARIRLTRSAIHDLDVPTGIEPPRGFGRELDDGV
jgi:hypothetical protein